MDASPEFPIHFLKIYRLQVAREHSATFEIFSNTSIPAPIKAWLTRKRIPFTELLE
jgi:hypothetical protein